MTRYQTEGRCEQAVSVEKVTKTTNEVDNIEENVNMTARTDVQQEKKEDEIIPDANENKGKDYSKKKMENKGISTCSTEAERQYMEPLDRKTEKNNKGSDIGESTAIHKGISVQEEMKSGEVIPDNSGHSKNDVSKEEIK